MSIEFWAMGRPYPSGPNSPEFNGVRQAVRAEEIGYDGIVYVDSQNRYGDTYVCLALAAHATSTIKLGTGVTNSFTRHPAVTASAIATVQIESNGRAYLGIARGDSALAHLGRAPDSVPKFERYLERLQAYLRGEDVPFEAGGDISSLELANYRDSSIIFWIDETQPPKVPVDVAATGPKVIAAAARHAESVTLNVGADAKRIQWGMDVARTARAEAGLDANIHFGAYVPLVVNDDPEEAARIGVGQVSLFARFSVMYGSVVGPASADQRRMMRTIHDAYDMEHHGLAHAPQDDVVTPDFAREFGIFGSPTYCADRLGELIDLGVERIIIRGVSLDPADPESRAAERFMEEVAPLLRE